VSTTADRTTAIILVLGASATISARIAAALSCQHDRFRVRAASTLERAREQQAIAPAALVVTAIALQNSDIEEFYPSPVLQLGDTFERCDSSAANPSQLTDSLDFAELNTGTLHKTLSRLLRENHTRHSQQQADLQLRKSQEAQARAERLGRPVYWVWDYTRQALTYCSQDYAAMYGMTTEQAMKTFASCEGEMEHIHPEDREEYLRREKAAMAGDGCMETTCRILTLDGDVRYIHEVSKIDFDDAGSPLVQYGSVQDITDQVLAEQTMRDSEQRFRQLYHENPSMFFSISARGYIQSSNLYGANHLGYRPDELTGKSMSHLIHKADIKLGASYLRKALKSANRVHSLELRMLCRDDSSIWVRVTGRCSHFDDNGAQLLVVCEDITETRKLSEQLAYQASHDPLTKLLNRREFDHRLQRVMETARSEGSEHALCYLDLDQFKIVNDTCGHSAGDELLRQLGDLLSSSFRRRDTLARLGGDEFGILMEHCSLQQAQHVAENVRKEIEAFRFAWETRVFSVGVSIGLVPISNTGLNSTDVLKQADAACYAAKDAGRNRIHTYLEADTELARRQGEMQLIEQLYRALENNSLELYYQNIVPVGADGASQIRYEILVRMRDEAGQSVPPGAFLVAAERYGVAPRLDRWVVENFFAFLAARPRILSSTSQFALNLSGLSLSNKDFHGFLLEHLQGSGVPPEKICFEITETAAISNLSDATDFIQSLRDMGCSFALDDFGAGLSSFAYLKSLSVDYLKIDGTLVREIASDPVSYTMVKSIHDIGKLMGMRSIAEFVENDAIMAKLRKIGVDFAQGYGISRPAPLCDIPVQEGNIHPLRPGQKIYFG
jgi:diguanylate cyclase (GGDEF)-like protein/PAS domain S-box-containing protein